MRPRSARLAWGVIATWVVGFDVWAMATGRPTLTEEHAHALKHPKYRHGVLAAHFLVTEHLLFPRLLPVWLDPFSILALAVKGTGLLVKRRG